MTEFYEKKKREKRGGYKNGDVCESVISMYKKYIYIYCFVKFIITEKRCENQGSRGKSQGFINKPIMDSFGESGMTGSIGNEA